MRVLIIDDEPEICELLSSVCQLNSLETTQLTQPEATGTLSFNDYELVFLDLNMPGKDGIQVMNELSRANYAGLLVLMSGVDNWLLNSANELAKALKLNLLDHLSKPFGIEQVETLLKDGALKLVQSAQGPKPTKKSKQLSLKELHNALTTGQVKVFYQPQLDLITHTFLGVQALIRIASEDGHIITPNFFLEVAEKENLIQDFTKVIVNTALRDINRLSNDYGRMTVSINLSYQDIEDESFPDWAEERIKHYQLDASRVIFEISQQDTQDSSITLLKVLSRLRLKGFKISMGETGGDVAHLGHIKRFPITELKIHHTFVAEILTNEKSKFLLKNILHLGEELGLDIVVNGIENQEVESLLKSIGAEIGQGFLYAAPLSYTDLLAYLKSHAEQVDVDSVLEVEKSERVTALHVDNENQTDTAFSIVSDVAINDQQADHYLTFVVPLTGTFSFVGKSQLLGAQMAMAYFKLHHKAPPFALRVIDDGSNMNHVLDICTNQLPKSTFCVFGGAFPYQKTSAYQEGIKKVTVPIFAPFNGCSSLRAHDLDHVFHLKPSFMDEIDYLAFDVLANKKEVCFVYPVQNLINEYEHVFNEKPLWRKVSYEKSDLAEAKTIIKEGGFKQVVFIGSAQKIVDLIEGVDSPDIAFYTISLAGTGLIQRALKRKARINLTITEPLPDYKDDLPLANAFRKIAGLLNSQQKHFINTVSFESFVSVMLILERFEKCSETGTIPSLCSILEPMLSEDIGLGQGTATWSHEDRKLLHKVYQYKI